MADLLLQLGRSPRARALLTSLGLPLSLPQTLERPRSGWSARELDGQRVAVLQLGAGHAIPWIARALGGAGAVALAPDGLLPSFECEDCAPVTPLGADSSLSGVVIDATGAGMVAVLTGLQRDLGQLLGRLRRCGRVVIVGRTLDGLDPVQAASQAALEGFMRSLAKEVGARGVTVNLLRVQPGAEPHLVAPLTFLLSARAAFITAQPLIVTTQAGATPARLHARGLVGKVALVTGAARGIGEATARALADEGAHVVLLDRPQEAERLQPLAHTLGGRALLVNLTDASAVEQIMAALSGGVDIVVHNAGITRDKTLARMRPEHWDQVMALNLDVILRLQEALVAGPLRDGGRVICLSSIAGIAGNMGQTAYAASKAGLIGFVAAEAAALAPRHITVNAIAPGFIETQMTAAIPPLIREAGRRLSALGQGGQPQDVAHAIAFLAQPAAQGLTARTLRVCGGGLIGA